MAAGEYVICERAAKYAERLFLDMARELVTEIQEPPDGKSSMIQRNTQEKNGYHHFKPMLPVLLLMNYPRKDYGEMAAHLKGNRYLLKELDSEKAPDKSTVHAAHGKASTRLLRNLNDVILLKFKKAWQKSTETRICRLLRTGNKQEKQVILHTYPLKDCQEKGGGLLSYPFCPCVCFSTMVISSASKNHYPAEPWNALKERVPSNEFAGLASLIAST